MDVACLTCAVSGRTDVDVESTKNEYIFTPTTNSSVRTFTLIDDSVLEFEELLIATFDFGPDITDNWNARKGTPSTTYIRIADNDCK